MAIGGHFGCPKITFDHIYGHFKSIRILFLIFATNGHFGGKKITFDRISGHFKSMQNIFFLTKWPPAAILDVRKSPLIAFLTISDRYKTFVYEILTKWPTAAILDGTTMPIIELLGYIYVYLDE